MTAQYPKDFLRAQFVGKDLRDVITPAVVLDLAKIEANCTLMLEATERLQLSWRAHIKTHKTEELTRLQVGDKSSSPVNLVVSTVTEAEKLVPLLKEYQEKGRQVNVLYSFPLYASCVGRLAAVSAQLGPGALTVMIDHAEQVPHLSALAAAAGGHAPRVFLKVNVGSNRAGVIPGTPACDAIVDALLTSEAAGRSALLGLYCHAGHSYATRRDWEAMGILSAEFATLKQVAALVREKQKQQQQGATEAPLVLSVGATPTATTIQHPDLATADTESDGAELLTTVPTSQLKRLMRELRADGFALEVHAGVYPTLDIQQLAAHARDATRLNASLIGVTVLADVASVYEGRGPGGVGAEALVNAGSLALGREPCEDRGEVPGRHYAAWGVVMPWGEPALEAAPAPGPDFPAVHAGWEVAKISQEHGVLCWAGGDDAAAEVPLRVGQRVRIWPNHSCITGAGHGWYLVVDSRNKGREDEIVDVWPRWNGW
ncbi:putative serine dehydratase domain-containing protein [Hypoxylon sp. FL1284]|nr:putative serine dehydratase domain-containing protein [Hypoxylon sp. FL1284]